jgi:hypothetical protein
MRGWEKYRSLLEGPVEGSAQRSFVSEEPEPEPKKSARDRAKALGLRVVERGEDDQSQATEKTS